ncbi:DUF2235 domain-containing protein [Archangium violaceum]|uniref:T6SS phospholipase effector Tle1-like catalytic domain-containing protein n=1 Tax=Archangium violaceum TaxID=83451 RepID=UPI00194F157D|nr:DUF2235 domain-containing protein [Archangium violaceum]QRO01442.1 DUF2235 domain-containing protein [Archangium violaceum]
MDTRKPSQKKVSGRTPAPSALRRAASMVKAGSTAPTQPSTDTGLKTIKTPVAEPPTRTPGQWLSFFFDGTGNNQDADLGTEEHSNVTRLYRAHLGNESADPASPGVFRFYIPGIGTYFKEVNDDGGGTTGPGFGAKGDARLDWAMERFDKTIAGGKDKIHVALFGFSRGATLARAFARRLAERCSNKNGTWYLNGTQRSIRLYFMGLFDTVASVGLPTSVDNSSLGGMFSLKLALLNRSTGSASLFNIAPGDTPGADPSPGFIDGHASWASNLRIPKMVERCVHMVAAHEIRNSFPLDSLLDGKYYPAHCEEIVFPGSHSDVGGGYRPEEGARGMAAGAHLSLIPLRRMYQKAIQSGVPLNTDMRSDALKRDFAFDIASATAFQILEKRYAAYKKLAGDGGVSLGTAFLSHMKLYYKWRFHKIALDQKARKTGMRTLDELRLRQTEKQWNQERKNLEKKKEELWTELTSYRIQAKPFRSRTDGEMPRTPQQQRYHQLANAKEDEYRKLVARLDTLPGSVDDLVDHMKIYDEQLLADAAILKQLSNKGKNKLRPHYQALLDAYVDEFEKKNGLKDAELIAFFDDYVHDSLAGFARDSTLPSDPRIIYIGGDEELKYAMNSSQASWAANTG